MNEHTLLDNVMGGVSFTVSKISIFIIFSKCSCNSTFQAILQDVEILYIMNVCISSEYQVCASSKQE